MTIDEQIEVMRAFQDGKKIQFTSVANKDMVWLDTDNPTWDFSSYNYRIKPEGRRPYISSEEMVDDFRKRFNVKDWPNHAMPLIWLRDNATGYEHLVEGYGSDCVIIEGKRKHLQTIFENYTYLDGSVVGIVEDEE